MKAKVNCLQPALNRPCRAMIITYIRKVSKKAERLCEETLSIILPWKLGSARLVAVYAKSRKKADVNVGHSRLASISARRK